MGNRNDLEGLRADIARLDQAAREAQARGIPAAQWAHFLVQEAQIRDVLREDNFALELYQRAIDAKHPRPSSLHSARAYLLEEHARNEEALAEWNLAIESDPSNAVLLESRGKFFLRRQRRDKGLEDFDRVARNAGAAGFFFCF